MTPQTKNFNIGRQTLEKRFMSQKEAHRLNVMKLLFNEDITQKMAAEMLGF